MVGKAVSDNEGIVHWCIVLKGNSYLASTTWKMVKILLLDVNLNRNSNFFIRYLNIKRRGKEGKNFSIKTKRNELYPFELIIKT